MWFIVAFLFNVQVHVLSHVWHVIHLIRSITLLWYETGYPLLVLATGLRRHKNKKYENETYYDVAMHGPGIWLWERGAAGA